MEIPILVLGLVASAFVVLLSFAERQRTIALISIALSSVLVAQYLLLQQPVATALSGLSLLYALLILSTVGRKDSFSRALNSTAVRVVLLGVYTAIFVLLNGGIGLNVQLLAYLGSVLMVAVMMVDGWTAKLIFLIAGICWTIFQFQTGAYGNLVGQLFFFGGLIWSSNKLWRTQRIAQSEFQQRDSRLAVA